MTCRHCSAPTGHGGMYDDSAEEHVRTTRRRALALAAGLRARLRGAYKVVSAAMGTACDCGELRDRAEDDAARWRHACLCARKRGDEWKIKALAQDIHTVKTLADLASKCSEWMARADRAEAEAKRLRAELATLQTEHREALEAVAAVAQVNGYAPGETFPRALTKDNRFSAAVTEVGKLRSDLATRTAERDALQVRLDEEAVALDQANRLKSRWSALCEDFAALDLRQQNQIADWHIRRLQVQMAVREWAARDAVVQRWLADAVAERDEARRERDAEKAGSVRLEKQWREAFAEATRRADEAERAIVALKPYVSTGNMNAEQRKLWRDLWTAMRERQAGKDGDGNG